MSQDDARVVGWHTDDFATDKSATTYDRTIAMRWVAKGWPATPLVPLSLLAEAESRISALEQEAVAETEIWARKCDSLQSRLDAVVREVTDTVRRLENRAGRQKAGGLPANSTAIQGFANELKVALRSAALGGESPGNEEVG